MDNPQRMEMQSADNAQINLDALYQIAPSCFTETRDEKTGKVRHTINFTKLRELLGDDADEDIVEAYEFNWVGKQSARAEVLKPINKTLRPVKEDSVDWDNTKNLYIEGDNLEVLKLLQKSYLGKVKMIYIDPPYNTGNDFVYHDDFKKTQKEEDLFSGAIDEEGNRFVKNTESNGRFHSDWCSMIYSRLMIARTLLTDDGVIFISIEDGEMVNLKKICDEIFGCCNFVADLTVVNNLKGRNDKKYIARANERLLMYVKSEDFSEYGLSLDNKVLKEYSSEDVFGKYRLLELRKRGGADTRAERPNMYYSFWVNESDGSVSLKMDESHTIEALPIKSNGIDGRWRWGIETSSKNLNFLIGKKVGNKYNIYEKDYLEGEFGMRRIRPKSVLSGANYSTDVATKFYRSLMGNIDFNNPKPIDLLKDLVEYSISPESDDIILDFFSGSSTTAHAVMQLNAEDGGNRKYIMVQLPEETPEDSEAFKAGYKTIPEIAKERIRRAGKKIKEESPLTTQNLDTGFRVFRVDNSNYEDVEVSPNELKQDGLNLFENNIKADRTGLDLLFSCMLDWGVQLSVPMQSEVVDGATVYNVNNGDLLACFDHLTKDVISKITELQPLRVVFRDSCFHNDAEKINLYELFKQSLNWSDQEVYNNIRVI